MLALRLIAPPALTERLVQVLKAQPRATHVVVHLVTGRAGSR